MSGLERSTFFEQSDRGRALIRASVARSVLGAEGPYVVDFNEDEGRIFLWWRPEPVTVRRGDRVVLFEDLGGRLHYEAVLPKPTEARVVMGGVTTVRCG